ncbi:MAG: CarD family transcriptional regulator [Thermodesulfobacteriota bacterium]
MFKKGDMAVYPAHGVGEIVEVDEKTIAGEKHSFYVMKIADTSMVVMIPCDTSEAVGLREIVSADEAEGIFTILAEKDVEIVSQPWNQRYREYMEKIKTGSVDKIASVLRDLFVLQVDKDLSFGERKMMDTAKNLLVKEISLAKEISEDQVLQQIEDIFN